MRVRRGRYKRPPENLEATRLVGGARGCCRLHPRGCGLRKCSNSTDRRRGPGRQDLFDAPCKYCSDGRRDHGPQAGRLHRAPDADLNVCTPHAEQLVARARTKPKYSLFLTISPLTISPPHVCVLFRTTQLLCGGSSRSLPQCHEVFGGGRRLENIRQILVFRNLIER